MNKKKKIAFSVFVAILLTSLWSASGTFDSIDTAVRARVAHQLVTEGRLVVNSVGEAKKSSTFRDQDGVYPSYFGLGQSVFFLPFEALSNVIVPHLAIEPAQEKQFRAFIVSVLVFWVCLSINFWLCLKLSIKLGMTQSAAYLISFVATFGSSFWQMAKQGQEEIQLSILLLCSLYGFLCWQRESNHKHVWLSAMAAAAALIFRPTALPIFVGIPGLYVYEIFCNQKTAQSKVFSLLKIAVTFAITDIFALAVIGSYNFFKTGNLLNPGYPLTHIPSFFLPQRTVRNTLLTRIIEPVLGLDKGIIWTNPWLLPCLIFTFLAWRYLQHELKTLLLLSLFLFASSIAIYSQCCWAGDFTYGARYQVHLVPLLCLTLGTATVKYIKTNFHLKPHTTQYRSLFLSLSLILFLLQVPSISFIHALEIYQALSSSAASKSTNGSPTGELRQTRLRYVNFFSKLTTGETVRFAARNSAVPLSAVEDASRWNFWPWLAQKRLSQNVIIMLKGLWLLIVLTNIISWGYAFHLIVFSRSSATGTPPRASSGDSIGCQKS